MSVLALFFFSKKLFRAPPPRCVFLDSWLLVKCESSCQVGGNPRSPEPVPRALGIGFDSDQTVLKLSVCTENITSVAGPPKIFSQENRCCAEVTYGTALSIPGSEGIGLRWQSCSYQPRPQPSPHSAVGVHLSVQTTCENNLCVSLLSRSQSVSHLLSVHLSL